MQRRSFLKTSAMAGSAFLFSRKLPSATTASDDALIEIMLDEPLGTISPLIYSHFTEELGAVIYDGVWVGENSKIANTGGIRTVLIEKMRQIKAPAVRWPVPVVRMRRPRSEHNESAHGRERLTRKAEDRFHDACRQAGPLR